MPFCVPRAASGRPGPSWQSACRARPRWLAALHSSGLDVGKFHRLEADTAASGLSAIETVSPLRTMHRQESPWSATISRDSLDCRLIAGTEPENTAWRAK